MTDEPYRSVGEMQLNAPKLNEAERQLLESLVQSPAWKVVTEKIWGHLRRSILTALTIHPENVRFEQGQYAAFRMAEDVIIEAAKPKPEMAAFHAPSETDLYPRRSSKGVSSY